MRRAARIATRRSGGEWQALYVTRQDGLTGISPDRLDRARGQGRRARRLVPHRRRRRPGRRDPGLRPRRERHPGRHRRQPARPGLHPAPPGRRRAGGHRVGRHRRPHRHPRLRPPPLGEAAGRQPRPPAPAGRHGLRRSWRRSVLSGLLYLTADLHGLPIEAMSLMVVVVATALIGGLAPAVVVSALASALLLNYLFTPPLYTLTIAEPENVVTIAIFVAVGIAVATVVDLAARRTAQARAGARRGRRADRARPQPADLERRPRGAALLGLPALRRPRRRRAAARRRTGEVEVVASCGTPPTSVERADMSAAIDGRSTLVLAGRDAAGVTSAACSTPTPPTPR